MKKILLLAVAIFAQVTFAQDMSKYIPDLKPGETAPEISASTPEGKVISLSDFKGKYVVIDFWASWCGDCRREIPELKNLYNEIKDWKLGEDKKEVEFLSVSFDYKKESWVNLLEKENFPWTQISNLKSTREDPVYKDYKLHWIPTFFLVSPEGVIIESAITTEELRTKIYNYQKQIPLVYNKENTGANFPAPVFPLLEESKPQELLPNPFLLASTNEEIADFSQWEQRRNEILAMFQHYEVGTKPSVKKSQVKAHMDVDTLVVEVTEKEETLTMRFPISYPKDVEGPVPAVIGIGFGGSGSLPADIFESRNIAMIKFDFTQVTSHTQKRGTEPINKLYPELEYMGSYSAWPWGVSRLIDGLEICAEECRIDTKHLAITGCSFAGKMALWSGAFDERIALTIAQEPGGGGAAAWRVSETLGNVETLGRTNYSWFIEDMKKYEVENVKYLPIDHHELCALIAPRALLVLGNTDYEWLADQSGYVSCLAAREVWKRFGIEDRMGFSIQGGHMHCMLPNEQRPEVEAFVDKFLLGKDVDTHYLKAEMFSEVDYKSWWNW